MTTTNETAPAVEPREAADTPAAWVTDLAQLHLRAMASPLPKDPGALGWQMTAAMLAAMSCRLMAVAERSAPDEAAAIARLFHGPFGEGPDLEDEFDWIDHNVARPQGADVAAWMDEARELARRAKAFADGRTVDAPGERL